MEGTKTVEVMKMMMERTSGANKTDLFINVGDLSYADGYQVNAFTCQLHLTDSKGRTVVGSIPLSFCRGDYFRGSPKGISPGVVASIKFPKHLVVPPPSQPAWDDYGRIMDEFTSRVPMIAAVGNHELENRE